ncbi:MAG: hypothetical protein GY863_20425, partial [bacterium]|nr:hypothetical protein [bacterium]
YVTLTGINYDDLKNYIYVSEDYGKNWRSIVSNLPDETAYTILEDPVNENILYAGLYRGVYISVDRGRNWSLLGPGMASMPISDLIIQEREMDLLVGTHGRGIFKMNIRPIHKAFEKGVPETNMLFDIPTTRLPGVKEETKAPITFYLMNDIDVEILLKNENEEIIWSTPIKGKKGFNQFRWDLVTKRVDSREPYFSRYTEFAQPGKYKIKVEGNGIGLIKEFTIIQ